MAVAGDELQGIVRLHTANSLRNRKCDWPRCGTAPLRSHTGPNNGRATSSVAEFLCLGARQIAMIAWAAFCAVLPLARVTGSRTVRESEARAIRVPARSSSSKKCLQ